MCGISKNKFSTREGAKSSGSDTAPHSPSAPSPSLLFEQADGIYVSPWQGHLKICPVAWRCVQPYNGVTTAPQEGSPKSPSYPISPITLCSSVRGMALGAEPQVSPRSWSPAGTLHLYKSPTQIARLHVSAAAATARLKRKSEKKSCIISAR